MWIGLRLRFSLVYPHASNGVLGEVNAVNNAMSVDGLFL